MTEWQPIETAPAKPVNEDQVRILVWVPDGGDKNRGAVAFGHVYLGRLGNKHPRAEGYHGDWKITHWMPLPEPPK